MIVPSLPETLETISSARSTALIRVSSFSNQMPWYGGWKAACTSQYGSATNAWISRSRLTSMASVGVCTRPSETTPPTHARPRMVAARVAFMPTIQSASERDRAACSSDWSCSPGRNFSKPSRIACFVIDEIHRRCTCFGGPSFFFSDCAYIS